MIKRPSFFFATGDCGCAAPVEPAPCFPPAQGATITDNRYLALATSAAGQMLLVPKGANGQAFLKGTPNQVGFIIYKNEVVQIQEDPQINLPLLNPAVAGAFPVPDGIQYLFGGAGSPMGWRAIAAPSAGTYILKTVAGAWVLAPAGSIPGLDDIGNSPEVALKGGIMVLVEEPAESGEWVVKRLQVLDERMIVGEIDVDTGAMNYRPISTAKPITHTLGKFTNKLQLRTLTTLDADGEEIVGGIEQAEVTGLGAVTDGIRLWYSPTTKRLYRAPGNTQTFNQVAVSASATPPAGYVAMPGGHAAGISADYKYPVVRIDVAFQFTADESFVLALYRDGSLLHEFNNNATVDTIALFFLDETCPPGFHTYSAKWKKNAGTNAVTIRQSLLMTHTLPA